MNKKLLLAFAALFSCSAAFAQTDEQWTVYDLQTNEQQTIDLTDDLVASPIVGGDNRKEITNKAQGFEKAAVVLSRRDSQGQLENHCSGAMVGKNIVLTAAHCLTNKQNNQPYAEVFVQATGLAARKKTPKNPGNNNNRNNDATLPYTNLINTIKSKINTTGNTVGTASVDSSTSNDSVSAKAVRLWVPSQWDRSTDYTERMMSLDYGLIILDSNLGDQTGWLNVAVKSTKELNQKKIIVLGKGGDKPEQTLWRSDGRIHKVDAKFVYHDADTVGGNSGSPILLAEDPYTIVALDIAENSKNVNNNFYPPIAPEGSAPNEGLRITNVILNAIQQNSK